MASENVTDLFRTHSFFSLSPSLFFYLCLAYFLSSGAFYRLWIRFVLNADVWDGPLNCFFCGNLYLLFFSMLFLCPQGSALTICYSNPAKYLCFITIFYNIILDHIATNRAMQHKKSWSSVSNMINVHVWTLWKICDEKKKGKFSALTSQNGLFLETKHCL